MLIKQLLSVSLASLLVFACIPATAIEKPISLSDPKSLRQSAFESYLTGNFDKAKVYYEQAIDQTQKSYGPNSPFLADLYFELGTVSLDLSKFSIASHYLPLAVEKRPNSRQARIKLAELYMLTGKEEEARIQLETAQKMHPKSPEVQAAIVKWMIQQSQKARKEEGNLQKEQVLAMASVSGSFYLHKLMERKAPAAPQQHQQAKPENGPSPKKSNLSDGLARFAAPVQEKPQANSGAKPAEAQTVPKITDVQNTAKDESIKDAVSSALNLKSRIFQPKKEEAKAAPAPVVVHKEEPKPLPKPPKREKAKPKERVQPAVVASAKPVKTTPKHVEKAKQQEIAPAAGGMDTMTYVPAMPVQMAPVTGKKGKKGAFVPPPPPMIPSYPGAMPMYTVPQMQQTQLRTTVKMEEPKKKVKAAPSESPSASEAPANSEDPEFILEWASVKKKGKGKAAKKDDE